MKKWILKIISLVLAFVLGLVFMSYVTNTGNTDLTTKMRKATFPLLYLEQEGVRYNKMAGYAKKMDGVYMRDSITLLPEDRTLQLSLDTYGTGIEEISYEVRSLDTTRLVENNAVDDFSEEKDVVTTQITLKDLLEKEQEYLLTICVTTKDGENIYYYTRIVENEKAKTREGAEFALYFQNETLKKEEAGNISQYLEQNNTMDNTTLAHMNIHSRYAMVMWGNMRPQMVGEPQITITEIDDTVTSLRLSYLVEHMPEEGKTERYEVEEYYRVRVTGTRTYLLDFDRTMNRVFSPEEAVFTDNKLILGILEKEPEYEKNEEENIVGFVQSGELWSYDVVQNKLSHVYGFRQEDDARTENKDHDIRIIRMDDTGSMGFLVYGYMNRGSHEGEVGIGAFYYDSLANTVEELLFIPSDRPYQVLEGEIGSLSYMNQENNLYLAYGDSVYMIDMEAGSYQTVAGQLGEECYITSDGGTILAWQQENELYASQHISVLHLESGRRYQVSGAEDEYIRPLGFMGSDFIYGIAKKEEIVKDLAGQVVFPMYKVVIEDEKGTVVREFDYREKQKYVVEVAIVDNRIQLECVARSGNGAFVEALPEPITNKSDEKAELIALSEMKTEEKKKEMIFSFKEKRETKEPRLLLTKEVKFEGDREMTFDQTAGASEKYYVYGTGKMDSVYVELKDAVRRADALMGVVISGDGTYAWERGNRKTVTSLSGLEPVSFAEGRNSLSLGLETLLSFESVYADVDAELAEGRSAYELLENHLGERALDLTGCSLNQVLYYVSQGKPVLAVKNGSEAVLITGYDQQNIITFDPVTGKTTKAGMKDSTALFESLGNIFMCAKSGEEKR